MGTEIFAEYDLVWASSVRVRHVAELQYGLAKFFGDHARSRKFGHHIFHFLDIDFRVIGLWIVRELVFGLAPQWSRNFLNSLAVNYGSLSDRKRIGTPRVAKY